MGSAFDSPDSVQLKGKVKGVTRLSRRAKMMIMTVIFVAASFILFSILSIDDDASAPVASAADGEQEQKDAGASKPVAIPAVPNFEHIGDGQASLAAPAAAPPGDQVPPLSGGAASTVQGGQNLGPAYSVTPNGEVPKLTEKALPPGTPGLSPRGNATGQPQLGAQLSGPMPKSQKELDDEQRKRERDERKKEAARAPLETQGLTGAVTGQGGTLAALAAQQDALLKAAQQAGLQAGGNTALGMSAMGGMAQQDDQNKQQRKEQFLKTATETGDKVYLAEGVQLALSPYEIKAGWAIPAELQTGVNSDIPGQFTARVTENVFDTATGRYLLIPQYTMIKGTYDSQIAYGQTRILAVGTRLIFPDGSSISLGGMPGADRAGNAGFDADVNNHYAKVFGSAAFMATFSAAVSLTQKQNTAVNGQQTNSQVIAQSLGQQLGQTGSAFIQRGMNVQPTLSRNPGYKFNINVTKDIVFPGPWKRRDARP